MSLETDKLTCNLIYVSSDKPVVLDDIRFSDIYYVELLINGLKLTDYSGDFTDYFAVLSELMKSVHDPGDYLLFTCACGIADDGGWELVRVEHISSRVRWCILVGSESLTFTFNLQDAKAEVRRVADRVTQDILLRLEPKYVVYPEN